MPILSVELEVVFIAFCMECLIVAITGTNGKTTTTEWVERCAHDRREKARKGVGQHRHGVFRRGARRARTST